MTLPAEYQGQEAAASHIVVNPFYKDEETGELYIHKDLVKTREAFADEAHIGPIATAAKFGDLTSWAQYLSLYGLGAQSYVTWNAKGISAVLDYHGRAGDTLGAPGRAAWFADYPFLPTPEWAAWRKIATGEPIAHEKAVEFLDDRLNDIVEPASTVLLNILRKLRANTTATADTELRPDGTAHIKFEKNDKVTSDGDIDLPAEFEILVPVMKGHVDVDEKPVLYRLVVKLRVSIVNSHLFLRFTLPAQERVMEQVYADMVAEARAQLGDGFVILRAAD